MKKRYITDEIAHRAQEIGGMLTGECFSVGVPIDRRSFWDAVGKDLDTAQLLRRVETYLDAPFPTMTEEIYFELERKGKDLESDRILFSSMRRLEQAVLAECVENRGRFLDYIQAGILSICQRVSWVRPKHDRAFGYSDYRGIHGQIDLYSSSLAWRLSVCDCCLGNRLNAGLRAAMKRRIEEKVLRIFWERLREDPEAIRIQQAVPLFWLDGFDNWLAVCLSGVVCSGIYYGNREERALLIALYEAIIRQYLDSLPDGYCIEGLAYWGYGFGKFIAASDLIHRITNGKIDLYAQKGFLEAATFGRRIGILQGVYPSVADCGFGTEPSPFCLEYLSRRESPGPYSGAGDGHTPWLVDPSLDIYIVMMMCNWDPRLSRTLPPRTAEDTLRTWFEGMSILICRNAAQNLGIYIQGGHNHMPHNHNDIGAFMIAAHGEAFVVDPGFSIYNDLTFSKQRYQQLEVLSSYGHSVPRVRGRLQGPMLFEAVNTGTAGKHGNGAYGDIQYHAIVLEKRFSAERDSIVLDLRHAYDDAGLRQLTRTMVFDRAREEITIADAFAFDQEAEFESAVITYQQVDIQPAGAGGAGSVLLKGSHSDMVMDIQAEGHVLHVSCVRDAVTGDHDIVAYPLRLGIRVKGTSGTVILKFRRKPP